MSNAVTPFDPTSLAQQLKDKVKAEFGSLVPDEAWDQLIQAQVDAFIKNDLPKLIQEELKAETKKRLAAFFARPEWAAQWNTEGESYYGASKALSRAVNDNIGTITQAFIGQLVGSTVQNALNQVRNDLTGRTY